MRAKCGPTGKNIDHSWSNTLDSLRQPLKDGKRNFIWRKAAPIRPVTFTTPDTVDDTIVQLHLAHYGLDLRRKPPLKTTASSCQDSPLRT